MIRYHRVVTELHRRWKPHDGQIEVGRAIFFEHIKEIMAVCGRNWGKTEFVDYALWRWAEMFPGTENYYFGPYAKQAREIVWASGRLPNFGPRDWLKPGSRGVNHSEARLNFVNGSFIKVDGSDNYEAYRGVKPKGLTIYDEFKDFRREFVTAYEPNRVANDSPLIIIGSEDEKDGLFWQTADEYEANPRKRLFRLPSEQNPHLKKELLERKKTELYAKAEGDVWEREYMARRVKGGASKVFPMLSDDMVKPHAWLMEHLKRDRKKLQWFWWADPAGATCFAINFLAHNPYTKRWYALDSSIYERVQAEMTVGKIGPRIMEIRDELWLGDWTQGYDEAATWFYNEFMELYPQEFLDASQKAMNDKLAGISLIKDILLRDLLWFSDRSSTPEFGNKPPFFWELDNYFKDKNGNYPKKNDHLIDDFRYVLGDAGYSLNEAEEYVEAKDPDFRGARPEDDYPRNDDGEEFSDLW